ncbi:sulfotransferase domain-containing protein [Thiohalobacter sp. IOR34]|uniref:sulfotransferase domain-containing protein n=1 Tax=Thiohalobacter sp. IOR34 TaxID=3057176 RepID=UPI0025B1C9B5|nr:sulfotransferase domain-containing protein [Thiohalobacter sp. IOR34]WJW76305.1 sulfotransferase domain-containing protein [Thiohalobacter sp. IOR34]
MSSTAWVQEVQHVLSKAAWTLQRFGLTPGKLRNRLLASSSPRIFCVSVPKAGTHLVERAICLHPALYRRLMPTLDECNLDPALGLGGVLGKLDPGQLLVSHLFCTDRRVRDVSESGVRSIFVIRDPRDVVISQSSYLMKMKKHRFHHAFSGQLDRKNAIRISILGNENSGLPSIRAILDGMRGWMEHAGLVIRFEDLVGTGGGGSEQAQRDSLRRLFEFLEVDMDENWIDETARRVFSSASPTFRKGRINQWKRVFDQELVDLFKEEAGQPLIDYGYEKSLEW